MLAVFCILSVRIVLSLLKRGFTRFVSLPMSSSGSSINSYALISNICQETGVVLFPFFVVSAPFCFIKTSCLLCEITPLLWNENEKERESGGTLYWGQSDVDTVTLTLGRDDRWFSSNFILKMTLLKQLEAVKKTFHLNRRLKSNVWVQNSFITCLHESVLYIKQASSINEWTVYNWSLYNLHLYTSTTSL